MIFLVSAALALSTIAFITVTSAFKKRRPATSQRHWFITGGSSGIGLALAHEVVKQEPGARVTLLSRTPAKLESAQAAVEKSASEAARRSKKDAGRVSVQAADVTDFAQVQRALAAAEAELGPVDVLVCNAGAAIPGYFHEQGIEVFEQHMRLNYLGVLHTAKAAYNGMVQRDSGHICIVASTLATLGLVGYSAYCPSKYAAKGLADCLRMELQGTNVTVSVAMPPDTQTSGFDNENNSKPIETKLISEDGNTVFSAEKVAQAMLRGMRRGDYVLPTPDLGLTVHFRLVMGIIPRAFPGVLLDMLLGFVGPVVHWVIASGMDRTTRKHVQTRFGALRAAGTARQGGPEAGGR